MHMHATPYDGTLQKVLIRKSAFARQLSKSASLEEEWA
jgi:hypothetical protein